MGVVVRVLRFYKFFILKLGSNYLVLNIGKKQNREGKKIIGNVHVLEDFSFKVKSRANRIIFIGW